MDQRVLISFQQGQAKQLDAQEKLLPNTNASD